MSPTILRNQGLSRDIGSMDVASLEGYDVFFSPSINLVPSPKDVVYGVLGDFTPEECGLLFSQKRFSAYREVQVTVRRKDGRNIPAACHFDSGAQKVTPKHEYVDRLIQIAESYRFPIWYLERLRRAALGA